MATLCVPGTMPSDEPVFNWNSPFSMTPVAPRPAEGIVRMFPEGIGLPSSLTVPCTRPVSDLAPQPAATERSPAAIATQAIRKDQAAAQVLLCMSRGVLTERLSLER